MRNKYLKRAHISDKKFRLILRCFCEDYTAEQTANLEFLKKESNVFLELTSRILVRLSGLMERTKYLVFGNAYTKVISILLICAERFGKRKKSAVEIQVPLIHKDIALLVGISRETASRQLEKLRTKSLIDYHDKLLMIANAKKLKEEATAHSAKREQKA